MSPLDWSAGSIRASMVRPASMLASFIQRICVQRRLAGSSASAGSGICAVVRWDRDERKDAGGNHWRHGAGPGVAASYRHHHFEADNIYFYMDNGNKRVHLCGRIAVKITHAQSNEAGHDCSSKPNCPAHAIGAVEPEKSGRMHSLPPSPQSMDKRIDTYRFSRRCTRRRLARNITTRTKPPQKRHPQARLGSPRSLHAAVAAYHNQGQLPRNTKRAKR